MLVLAALAVLGGRLPWLIFAVPASLYPIQFVRIVRRKRCSGADYSYALGYAGLILLGKFAEMRGVMGFLSGRVLGRRARLIEYKVPES